MSGLDLAVIRARAARHARLERDAARDITLAEVSAAICSADDVPMLLGEIGRLTRMVGEAHRTIRSLLAHTAEEATDGH
jgi:hypothetical protein